MRTEDHCKKLNRKVIKLSISAQHPNLRNEKPASAIFNKKYILTDLKNKKPEMRAVRMCAQIISAKANIGLW